MRHPHRTTTASALGVLMLAATFVAGPAPADAATRETTYQRAAVKATNQERADRDLVRLTKQKCVQRYAKKQAQRMARQQRMFHQDIGAVLRACHLSRVGENVAYGYRTGKAVVEDGWMESPGHRANILTPEYRLLGLGASRSRNGVWYSSQVFGTR